MKRAASPFSKKRPKRRSKRRPSESVDMRALFQLVKQYKLLYVPEHPDYRVYPVKEAVWKHIAEQLGCSAAYTKKKWKHAREIYVKFLRSVAEAKVARRNYTVWKYAKDIEFIRPYTVKAVVGNVTDSTDDELAYYGPRRKKMKSKTTRTSPENQVDDLEDDDERIDDLSDNGDDLDEDEVDDSVENSDVQPTSNGDLKEATKLPLESSSTNDLQLDAIDMIFIGYSKTMKKFPLKQQSLLKFRIAELIMKTETELYR